MILNSPKCVTIICTRLNRLGNGLIPRGPHVALKLYCVCLCGVNAASELVSHEMNSSLIVPSCSNMLSEKNDGMRVDVFV